MLAELWNITRQFSKVCVRRLFHGAKLPSWPLMYEVAIEVARSTSAHLHKPSLAKEREDFDRLEKLAKKRADMTQEEVVWSSCRGYWFRPAESTSNKIILYLHGGGYVLGSAKGYRSVIQGLIDATGAQVLFPEYRLAPEHPFPAALDDAVDVYEWLLAQGHSPEDVVLMGDSAGGGLSAALCLSLRQRALPLPGLLMLFSPLLDLTFGTDSIKRNRPYDHIFEENIKRWGDWYVGEHDREDPLLSPLFADVSGFPRCVVLAGGAELLVDEAKDFAERAQKQGVEVLLHIEPDRVHDYFFFTPFDPVARAFYKMVAQHIA
ncbi:MAG: alpha/beta hydrolase [Deltaproteobacteria bacterium]|nr:alpha/beta hydrolase [Deltaproteobacteria bacterium]MBU49179.1 alpha/beta hydrolase [Deltaproteobacteria bacterium]